MRISPHLDCRTNQESTWVLAHIKHVCFSTLLWPSGQLALVRTFPEVRTEPCPEPTRGPNDRGVRPSSDRVGRSTPCVPRTVSGEAPAGVLWSLKLPTGGLNVNVFAHVSPKHAMHTYLRKVAQAPYCNQVAQMTLLFMVVHNLVYSLCVVCLLKTGGSHA